MPNFDLRTYQPPGVYIEETPSSLVNQVGVQPSVVALVGPTVGYRTYTEAIVLTDETLVALAKGGIDTASLVVTSPTGTVYVLDTDYTVTVDGDVTSINRIDDVGGAITSGATVYVAYQYTDSEYYDPLRTSSFDEVGEAFGPPFDLDDGSIVSPLSLAAKFAFENGATELVLVSTTGVAAGPVTRAELTTAYGKLETQVDVNIVAPVLVGITGTTIAPGDTYNVAVDLQTHVEAASTSGNFRIGVVGYETTATIDPVDVADAVTSERIVVAWPNRLHYYNGIINETVEFSGYYLAAAYAGRMSNIPVQMPLTKKRISGFSGLPSSLHQTMTMTVKNAWSNGGVAVTELNRSSQLVVRHGTTSDRQTVQTREISVVRAKDALVLLMQTTVDAAGLIGSFIDASTPVRVKGVVAGALEVAKGSQVIIDYMGLKIRTLPGDPTVLEVKFQYQPAYPLNYIVITFSINTETGEVGVQ